MADYYSILTEIGKQKLIAGQFAPTKIAVGDGAGSAYDPVETQLSLRHEVWRDDIQHIEFPADKPGCIIVYGVIPINLGGWVTREQGIFDDSGDMLGIAKCSESPKPLPENGEGKEVYLKSTYFVGNTANVTILIDSSVIFASLEDVDEKIAIHVNASDPHPVYVTELELNNVANSKQPLDATLMALATLITSPDQMIYSTGVDAFAMCALTAFARTLLAAIDAPAARNTLGIADYAPVGVVQAFAGQTAPDGWLACDGALVDAATYADLYAVIGTTYGDTMIIENEMKFKLPNLSGKFVLGASIEHPLGNTGGEETHVLSINEMPSHRHSSAVSSNLTAETYGGLVLGLTAGNTGSTGGDLPHNNMPPYCALLYIIKY